LKQLKRTKKENQMTIRNKLCDAADWFHHDMLDVIHHELRETPRFHRKQWESAMIFLALKEQGKLDSDRLGLSMGGGKELIAYALAPRTRQLVVTDLYDINTGWDCAKTDDPDTYIRHNKPFSVDDAKLKALRMDMRDLKFADNTFDFCYSTCAVEHIGETADFFRHFNEVALVLKDDGVYVFTTEFLFGDTTIRDDHNFVFAIHELRDILAASDLVVDHPFDARLSMHSIHYPKPSTLKQLAHARPDTLGQKVLQDEPHIQLLRGEHPFTCGIVTARKKRPQEKHPQMAIIGLEQAKSFALNGVATYRELLATSRVTISPFSLLPAERSRFFADHEEFFAIQSQPADKETVFHTDYFWWGSGKRVFEDAMRIGPLERVGNFVRTLCMKV
jgi:SAM-dependent methyltransferase